MKLTSFHMQGYRDLPADFNKRYDSIWVDIPNAELCDPATTGEYLRMNLRELEYAAELGYDGVGTNEHHQNGSAFHLAAATKDVAIVLLGMTLPIYHPLRVAEEMAQIDALSGGRLVAGWPVGTTMDVNHCYGVTPTQTRPRWLEAHDLIKMAWTRPGPFHFNGKYTKLRHVNPWPQPVQKPHPPIWLAGGGSVETWEMAARHNYTYSFLSFGGHKVGRKLIDLFWENNDAMGNDANPYRAGFAQIVMVAETDEEAERLYSEHVSYFYNRCLHVYPGFADAPGYRTIKTIQTGALSQYAPPVGGYTQLTWKELTEQGHVIAGSPETVRQRMEDLIKGLNVGNIFCLMHVGNMPADKCMYSTKLFAEKVMPKLRNMFPDWADDNRFWTTPLKNRVTSGSLPKQAPTSAELAKTYAVEA